MYWFDPKAPDLERGLHPIKGDLEINHLRENKQMNQETDEFYLYFDHPIMVTPPEDINLDFDADADVEEESSDDGYETTEDEPYRPPSAGFEDEDSDSDCLIVKRNTRKVGKKTENGVGMQSSQGNIGARRKALKENKKATDGPSTIKTNTNGATTSRSKYAGPNMSRAAVAARPNIRAPKNAGQKGHGSTSSDPTANGPKTVRTRAGLPNFEAANAAKATNSSSEDEAEENIEEEDPIFEYESETLLTPESSEDERDRYEFPQFNEGVEFGEVNFELGMEFATIESFKNALKDHIIFEGRKIRYIKNYQRRVRCNCEHGVERIKKPRKPKEQSNVSGEHNVNEAAMTEETVTTKATKVDVGDMNAGTKDCVKNGTGSAKLNPCPWLIYCAWNNQLKSYQIKTYTKSRRLGRNNCSDK
ncbi:uncharacterized protein LOC110265803 [Arachis ipaensis]|uniref:uncharacterized protein LOC110265803 n=1 Tax=Arachis ipaensis TaxID=130454 RepID=UPI000A2B6D7E|nr:uncharacterized protein LOC110265803 [Arachis ipaensis]